MSFILDECASQPCKHGAICNDGVNSFTCTCKGGYIGKLCETEVNECASRPCQNGGYCYDFVNHYFCVCQPGFNGTHCEHGKWTRSLFDIKIFFQPTESSHDRVLSSVAYIFWWGNWLWSMLRGTSADYLEFGAINAILDAHKNEFLNSCHFPDVH